MHTTNVEMNEGKLGLRGPRPFKKRLRTSCCTVPFSGLFSRKTCSNIASEFIKYILLQREQVPQTFNASLTAATTAAVASKTATTTRSTTTTDAAPTVTTRPDAATTKHRNNTTATSLAFDEDGNVDSWCTHSSVVRKSKQWGTTTETTTDVGEKTAAVQSNTTTVVAPAKATTHHVKSFIYNNLNCIPKYPFDSSAHGAPPAAEEDQDRRLGGTTVKHAVKSCFGRQPVAYSERKRLQSLNTAVQIFSHLDMAFTQSLLPIHKLALVIGSSLVTPKDTFVLTFPANHLEGEDIPLDFIKKTLFRELVTSDFIESFSSTKANSLRKVYILILANRDNEIPWFIPAARFSLPSRGNLYNVTLTNPPMDSSVDVSDSSFLDISGVNPMEVSMDQPESSYLPSAKKIRLQQSFEKMCDDDDLIWYQAPVAFKGFR